MTQAERSYREWGGEMTEQEAAIERGKQINNLARRVAVLERQNRALMSALRNLAAHVSEEAWRDAVADTAPAAECGK